MTRAARRHQASYRELYHRVLRRLGAYEPAFEAYCTPSCKHG